MAGVVSPLDIDSAWLPVMKWNCLHVRL